MKIKTLKMSFDAISIEDEKYKIHVKNVAIVYERPHPEKEIEIEGQPEFITDEGQPVRALGYDNYEIIEEDNSRIQVVKVND